MSEPNLKPRLLVLASTYPRWAGDHEPGFVHELTKRLTERFDVTVLCPHAMGALAEEQLDGVHAIRYRYAPARWESLVNDGGIVANLRKQPWKWLLVPGFLVGMFWQTWRLLRRWQPDVIHAHWLLPQGLVAALLGTMVRNMPPFVVTSHGADLFALKARPLQSLKRYVAKRAAAITVVSSAMRDELARLGADITKVSVQPMGVDLDNRFIPDPAIPRSTDELLFVGRLVEKKGLRHLIAAMPQILAARPAVHLRIAGFGPEENALSAQVQNLQLGDKVRFLGAVNQANLPALYRRAALLVAPFVVAEGGDVEGLGLVVVEAFGCHCPVVVGDVPAVHDLLDADTLRIVSPRDTNALAAAIVAVLDEPELAQDRAAALRRNLAERLSWPVVAKGYADTLSCAHAKRNAST